MREISRRATFAGLAASASAITAFGRDALADDGETPGLGTMFKSSPPVAFASSVVSFCAPYCTVGSFLISAYNLLSNTDGKRQDQIIDKLNEIEGQIAAMKQAILNEIQDTALKSIAGEVLGMKDSFDDFAATKSLGILDNIVTQSAVTKQHILQYLQDAATPVEFRMSFSALLSTIVPLRLHVFATYPIGDAAAQAAMKKVKLQEASDLLNNRGKALSAADQIGRQRVSSVFQKTFQSTFRRPSCPVSACTRNSKLAATIGTKSTANQPASVNSTLETAIRRSFGSVLRPSAMRPPINAAPMRKPLSSPCSTRLRQPCPRSKNPNAGQDCRLRASWSA